MSNYTIMHSPIGPLLLVGGPEGLAEIRFTPEGESPMPEPDWTPDPAPFAEVIGQLEEYFAGTRRDFSLKLDPQGTPFQRAVWAALATIPYGVTISYAELARRIDKPKAVRAVGAANNTSCFLYSNIILLCF